MARPRHIFSRCAHSSLDVHRSDNEQIWAKPNKSGLTPGYYTRHYSDASKRDVLLPVVAPVGTEGVVDKREDDTSGPTPIHADLYAFMSIVSPGKSVTRTLPAGVRRSYVHLAMSTYREPGQKAPADASKLTIAVKDGSSASLIEGDGIYVDVAGAQGEITFTNEGKSDAEFVLFEMTA